jgi:hypothetical protein
MVRGNEEKTEPERLSNLVYEPTPVHHCPVNDYGHWMEHRNDAPGTVRACACGQNWVAYRRPQPEGRRYYTGVYWRPEGWFARRRRERRAARAREREHCTCSTPALHVVFDPVSGTPTRCGRCGRTQW